MLFDRYPKYEGFQDTVRKRSAALRKQRAEQASYPLFAKQVAAEQPSVDEVMEKRKQQHSAHNLAFRNFKAKWWRIARQSYFKLSTEKREQVREQWERWTGPRNSGCLLYVISQV